MKVEKLYSYLKAEKAARTDLEMYVTVLSTQKGVVQEDADRVSEELQEGEKTIQNSDKVFQKK